MMKQMTIKKKVTLWYTGIIALILGMVLVFMFYFVDKVGISATEEEVSAAVTGFSANFQFQDGTYYLSEDTQFYQDGVMFCVYDDNGKLLYGTMPEKFPNQTILKSHTPRVITSGSSKWMVYDSVHTYGKNKAIWIRGITSIHAIEVFMTTSQKMMIVLYPVFILLIAMTGYFMLKRALKQVDLICDQVENISYGKDLTKRLPLPKVRDELYELSHKFNQMFERLEESFEKEQQFTADVSHELRTPVTGISSRDGEKFPVLRKAVRAVTQSDQRGLLHVIEELRKEDTPISRNIADHIDSFTDYDFAHLLFSDGTVENAISLDNQLNIIQVADLVLPDKDTTFEEYTTIELLSVSMLIVISTFALDFIHSDRSIFKIVDLDEAWAFLNVAQGETLSNKLVRAGRAMQAGVYFVTQSSGDVSKESLKNNIGLKFAFRSTDINEIKQTLEFFSIDKEDENNQKRLRDLENGQCLLQDLYGRVGVVQIHPVFEELLHAFDTRPPIQRNEVE